MGKEKHFKCHRVEHPPPTPHPVSLWNELWLLRHRLQINSRWSISLDVKTSYPASRVRIFNLSDSQMYLNKKQKPCCIKEKKKIH